VSSVGIQEQIHLYLEMTIKPGEVLRIEDLAISQNENGDNERQVALKKELEGVQRLNQVIESVITAMSKAKDNMDVLSPLYQLT
jgi:hypothetical protein